MTATTRKHPLSTMILLLSTLYYKDDQEGDHARTLPSQSIFKKMMTHIPTHDKKRPLDYLKRTSLKLYPRHQKGYGSLTHDSSMKSRTLALRRHLPSHSLLFKHSMTRKRTLFLHSHQRFNGLARD